MTDKAAANQKKLTNRKIPGGRTGPSSSMNMPAVIYDDSADKAARFIMDCNQRRIPLVFVSDTTGFMVGRDSEQGGIIRSGAKMVNAMSNCVVPKFALILNSSYLQILLEPLGVFVSRRLSKGTPNSNNPFILFVLG